MAERAEQVVDYLLIATEVLDEHAPADVATWFSAALADHMENGTPFAKAFEMQPDPTDHTPRRKYFLRLRNRHLMDAMCGYSGKLAQQAQELESQIWLFDKTWEQHKDRSEPPRHWNTLKQSLFQAYLASSKLGHKGDPNVPHSARQLRKIYDEKC